MVHEQAPGIKKPGRISENRVSYYPGRTLDNFQALQQNNVFCLWAFVTLLDFEFDFLAFSQSFEA